jgi:hypothetical protein
MSNGFPPVPIYPNSIDSDETLFEVHNTAETVTVADNDAFAEEIPIRPQPSDKPEIWAANGYATISGELFYYDAVGVNSNNKVCLLRRCVRNLGGKPTQFNSAGTWVRGFVVAEHHNQLATCVRLIEHNIGINFSKNPETLDWKIRHLEAIEMISDDYGCPNIELDLNVLNSNSTTGTLISYVVSTQGAAADFTLQFGDGTSTTSATSGTHQYAPGATIDPVIIMQNNTCQTIQTNISRIVTTTPTITVSTIPFALPIPIPPQIPQIVIPSMVLPSPQNSVPPIVFPNLNPTSGFPSTINVHPPINVPSVIDISQLHIPSHITLTPIHVPSMIRGPDIDIPSHVLVSFSPSVIPIGPAPPIPPIQVMPPIIPPIQMFGIMKTEPALPSVILIEAPNLPSVIPITVTLKSDIPGISLVHDLQDITVKHDMPKSLQVDAIPPLTFDPKSVRKVMKNFSQQFAESMKVSLPNFSDMKMPNLKVDWSDQPTLKAVLKLQKPKRGSFSSESGAGFREPEFEHVDFPGHIPLSIPEIPPLKVEHNIPSSIGVNIPDLKDIRIDAQDIPREIQLTLPKEELKISVVPFTMPKLQVDVEPFEKISIPVKMPDVMPRLEVKFPDEMPTLKVEFPKEMPTLKIEIPENARIPLYYDGPPLPVKIDLKIKDLAAEVASEVMNCFAMVPCARK